MGADLWYVAPRFAVLVAGLLSFRVLRSVGADSSATVPAQALVFLLVRDLIYLFLPYRAVLAVGDTVVLVLYLVWLENVLGRREVSRLLLGAVLAVLVAAAVLDLSGMTLLASFLYAGSFGGALLLTALSFYDVTTDDIEVSRTVTDTCDVVLLGTLYTQVVIHVFGHTSLVAQSFAYPASYLIHLAVLLLYFRRIHVSGYESARRAVDEKERLFGFMNRVESAISEQVDLDRILSFIVEDAVRETGADGGAVFLAESASSELRLRALCGSFPPPYPVSTAVKGRASRLESYLRSTPIPLGFSVIGTTAAEASATFIPHADEDPRLGANHDPEDSCYISSLIAVPLQLSGRVLGVLAVVRSRRQRGFDTRDFGHIRTFADYAALTINMTRAYIEVVEKKEIERELSVAAGIQQRLVPQQLPTTPGLRFAIYSVAARGVSGDFYDCRRLEDDSVAFMICDVAGKGIPAALVMVMVSTLLESASELNTDPAATLTAINRGITRRTAVEHYATMSLCRVDGSNGVLEYANAAHHPLLLCRRSTGGVEYLDTEGLPVGIDAEISYSSMTVRLDAGDIAVLYTDGITEAMNEEGLQFGQDRLAETVQGAAAEGSTAVRDAVCARLRDFVQDTKQHDDQTLLVLEFVAENDDT